MNYYNPSLAFASKHHSSKKGKHSSKGHHSKNSGGKHSHKVGHLEQQIKHDRNLSSSNSIAKKARDAEASRKAHDQHAHTRSLTRTRGHPKTTSSQNKDMRMYDSGKSGKNPLPANYQATHKDPKDQTDGPDPSQTVYARATSNYANSYNTNNVSSIIDNIAQQNSNVLILGGLGGMIWMLMFPDGTSILGKKYGKPIGWGASLIMLGLGAYGMFKNTVPTKANYSSSYSDALYFSPKKPIRTIANSRSFAAGPAVTGNMDTDVIMPQNIITGNAINGSRNPANDTNHAYSYVSDVY